MNAPEKRLEPWRSRIVGEEDVAPDQLLANPLNFRVHPKAQQEALSETLDRIGFVQRVVVNRTTGHVVDGHARVELALRRGQPTIPVVYVELTEAEERLALATLDPIGAMAGTDDVLLEQLLGDIRAGDESLAALLAGVHGEPVLPDQPGQDDAPDPEANAVSKRGEIWQLGAHRLLCGSSTEAADVKRLMDGELAALCSTDPPYLVNYTGADRPNGSGKDWSDVYREVEITDADKFFHDLFALALQVTRPDAAIYSMLGLGIASLASSAVDVKQASAIGRARPGSSATSTRRRSRSSCSGARCASTRSPGRCATSPSAAAARS